MKLVDKYLDLKKTILILLDKFSNKIKFIVFKETILVEGYLSTKNFGDSLNVFLVEFLSRKRVIDSKWIRNHGDLKRYAVIGSIIHLISKKTIIWGSGLISPNCTFSGDFIVKSVRGPLTRKHLVEKGIICPEIYGDPALLLPQIYFPKVKKKYKFGILPHFIDKDSPVLSNIVSAQTFKIIDIECGKNFRPLIIDLLKCEVIITSSLHGLIIAYAYGIPSLWVKFSDKIIGENFKFHDFLLSIGKPIVYPIEIKSNLLLEDLLEHVDYNMISFDPKKILDACPFIHPSVYKELSSKLK